MANWICETCKKHFIRERSGKRPIRFCSPDCYHVWQKSHNSAGRFINGAKPWNVGLRGIHLSPSTEFKKGHTKKDVADLLTVKIRQRHNRNESPRAWIKVGFPNVWILRSIYVWKSNYGLIPKGLVVHHLDGDSLNDNISNLCLVSRSRHAAIHKKMR